jgi:SAM-dependent methyltransferase
MPPALLCPLCGGGARRLFVKEGYGVRRCNVCRHRFAELAPDPDHIGRTYGDAYFQGGGAGYADYLSEGPLLRDRGRWYARLLARYIKTATVLDVGTAAGFILQGLVDGGWTGRGIEPNARMAEHARTRLGLGVETGTLEDLRTDERFDLVSMIQVVPHFVDPRRALAAAAGVTRPGGFWLIETWNRESWSARLLGRHWHEYSPPSVLHWFSPAGLARLAGELGLRPVARGRPAKWIDGAHAKALLRHKLGNAWPGRAAAGLFGIIPDRLAIPYPAEDLFWVLLQKS